jgi:hypothetical protein
MKDVLANLTGAFNSEAVDLGMIEQLRTTWQAKLDERVRALRLRLLGERVGFREHLQNIFYLYAVIFALSTVFLKC